jgi:hypothetical protein
MHPLPLLLSFFIMQSAVVAEPSQVPSANSSSIEGQQCKADASHWQCGVGQRELDGLSLGVASSAHNAQNDLSLHSEESFATWLGGILHRVWSVVCDFATEQTPPDAGADGSEKSVPIDAGIDERAPIDSDSTPLDAGLVDMQVGDAHSDTEAEAGTLSNSIALPSKPVDLSRARAPSSQMTAVQATPVSLKSLPFLGVMADVGVPDGLIVSVVYRPWDWMRLSAGGGSNSISAGWRAGITLLPLGAGPSASLEYGRYLDGNANALAKRFMGSDFAGSSGLDRIGYEYLNANLGLDFGFRDLVFFLHGGVTMIRGQLHNLGSGNSTSNTEIIVPHDPNFKASGPSAQLGLIVYLW